MHRNHILAVVACSGLVLILIAGCESASSEPAGPVVNGDSSIPALPPDTVDLGEGGHDHAHDHPSEGPHHGHLIELGGEEYHAELVHEEDAESVTIYILDGSATEVVPIEATTVTINLKHDGRGEQFDLAASPDAGDPDGRSSRFVSTDEELGEDLHAEGAEARLVVRIAGKSYTGKIDHDHDHGHDHGHDHDDDHGHDHD